MATEKRHEELAAVALEAFNSGDIDSLVALLHPEIESFTSPDLPNSGTFHGKEGFLKWMGEWLEAWESFEIAIEEIQSIDERFAIAAVHQRGRGRGSGLEIEMDIAQLWQIEDGLIVRFQYHPTVEAARAAVANLR